MLFFDKEKEYKTESVGGKARGLISLLQLGYKVPEFFIVTADEDINSDSFKKELTDSAARLNCSTFAIRSSSVSEDTLENSFAGQYDTLLYVTADGLIDAIKKVRMSKSGTKSSIYADKFGLKDADMAVIVQRQITPTLSGVAFSTSPFDSHKSIVESAIGLGEGVVSGKVTPKTTSFIKGQNAEGIEGEVIKAAWKIEEQLGPVDIEWAYDGNLYFLQMRPLTVLPAVSSDISGSWREYVYRDFAFVNHYVQACASQKEPQINKFGFAVPIFEGFLVDGHEFYSKKNDDLTAKIWARLDTQGFFKRFAHQIRQSVQHTMAIANMLYNYDMAWLDDRYLVRTFRKAMRVYQNSYLPLMMRPDDYLMDKLIALKGSEAERIAFSCSFHYKREVMSYYSSEKYDFLEAAIDFRNGDDQKLIAYVRKYEWILSPLGKGLCPLKKADVVKRIEHIANPENRLIEIKSERKRNIHSRKTMLKALDKQTIELVELISEFVFLRTYSTENSDRLFYYIKKRLFSEMAKRRGVPIEKLLCLTPDEIVLYYTSGIYPEAGTVRRSGATFVFNENGFSVYPGNGLALLKKLLTKTCNEEAEILCPGYVNAGLKGSIACSGKVKGKVKIITKPEDVDKINEGEILVTAMTTPALVAAMEKAAGIITDEGGVTCHAAIIAREYGVPCLVGTGNATTALSDGDEVVLDCIYGVCTLVKGEDQWAKFIT